MKALTYISKNGGFATTTEFMQHWKPLSDEDRTTLKNWAREEARVLGVPLDDIDETD